MNFDRVNDLINFCTFYALSYHFFFNKNIIKFQIYPIKLCNRKKGRRKKHMQKIKE